MLNKETLKRYIDNGLNYAEIGSIAGYSRQYVRVLAKKHELSIDFRVEVSCIKCGKKFSKQRLSAQQYCSKACYLKELSNSQSSYNISKEKSNRTYQRRAWKVFTQATGIEKKIEWVMHHIDEDLTNNKLSNLFVFLNHSLHLKYHHKTISMDNTVGFKASDCF